MQTVHKTKGTLRNKISLSIKLYSVNQYPNGELLDEAKRKLTILKRDEKFEFASRHLLNSVHGLPTYVVSNSYHHHPVLDVPDLW